MIAIADSGSTKTSWILADGKEIKYSFKTIGFNPYFVTYDEVVKCISEAFPSNANAQAITEVFFYGSGCSNCDNFRHLQDALKTVFGKATINIFSDMLGTARAVLKRESGVAAILGTGSNSCFYNGDQIEKNAVSLGYVLGDEGSGATIGKMFVKRYLEGKFDEKLTAQIAAETGENITTILNAVYKQDHPNRFLANFTHCIANHLDHPQVQDLMRKAFGDFFENYVYIYPQYRNYKIGFCGSIAYYFKDILLEELSKIGYDKNNVLIINNVLPELLKYHVGYLL